MRVRELVTIATVVLAGGTGLTGQTSEPPAEVVVRDVAVVDVAAGRILPHRDIVVRGTRIDQVAPAGSAERRAKTVVEGAGKFAVPGLIDSRVNLRDLGEAMLARFLVLGVTAVCDVGASGPQLDAWRQALDNGRLYAPRLLDTRTASCDAVGFHSAGATDNARAADAPGDAVHRRLAALVAAGAAPAAALRAATSDAARLLARDDLGQIAAGRVADVVILTGNPLDDIQRTRAIDAVIFRGEVLTYAHLRQFAARSASQRR